MIAGGFVYARQDSEVVTNILDPPYILDVSTGADAGTFPSGAPPAIHDGHLFLLSHGILSSVDSLTHSKAWSFGDGTLVTPPIVVSGRVFIGSSTGTLYAVDELAGTQVWSDDAGAGFSPLQEGADTEPIALAAAGGFLVAPVGNSLVVYGVLRDAGAADASGLEGGSRD